MFMAAPYNIAAESDAATTSPTHGTWPDRKYVSPFITVKML